MSRCLGVSLLLVMVGCAAPARERETDAFLSGPELTDYIAADERWLRGQFAEDGWLAN